MEEKRKTATHEGIFHKVHLSFYTSGLAKTLKATKTHILLALASYMKEDGWCHPTQTQLSERTGISTKTIGKQIQELLDMRINGKPILKAKRYPTKNGNYNYVYRIMPISQVSKFEKGQIERIDPIVAKEETNEEDELAKAVAELYE